MADPILTFSASLLSALGGGIVGSGLTALHERQKTIRRSVCVPLLEEIPDVDRQNLPKINGKIGTRWSEVNVADRDLLPNGFISSLNEYEDKISRAGNLESELAKREQQYVENIGMLKRKEGELLINYKRNEKARPSDPDAYRLEFTSFRQWLLDDWELLEQAYSDDMRVGEYAQQLEKALKESNEVSVDDLQREYNSDWAMALASAVMLGGLRTYKENIEEKRRLGVEIENLANEIEPRLRKINGRNFWLFGLITGRRSCDKCVSG